MARKVYINTNDGVQEVNVSKSYEYNQSRFKSMTSEERKQDAEYNYRIGNKYSTLSKYYAKKDKEEAEEAWKNQFINSNTHDATVLEALNKNRSASLTGMYDTYKKSKKTDVDKQVFSKQVELLKDGKSDSEIADLETYKTAVLNDKYDDYVANKNKKNNYERLTSDLLTDTSPYNYTSAKLDKGFIDKYSKYSIFGNNNNYKEDIDAYNNAIDMEDYGLASKKIKDVVINTFGTEVLKGDNSSFIRKTSRDDIDENKVIEKFRENVDKKNALINEYYNTNDNKTKKSIEEELNKITYENGIITCYSDTINSAKYRKENDVLSPAEQYRQEIKKIFDGPAYGNFNIIAQTTYGMSQLFKTTGNFIANGRLTDEGKNYANSFKLTVDNAINRLGENKALNLISVGTDYLVYEASEGDPLVSLGMNIGLSLVAPVDLVRDVSDVNYYYHKSKSAENMKQKAGYYTLIGLTLVPDILQYGKIDDLAGRYEKSKMKATTDVVEKADKYNKTMNAVDYAMANKKFLGKELSATEATAISRTNKEISNIIQNSLKDINKTALGIIGIKSAKGFATGFTKAYANKLIQGYEFGKDTDEDKKVFRDAMISGLVGTLIQAGMSGYKLETNSFEKDAFDYLKKTNDRAMQTIIDKEMDAEYASYNAKNAQNYDEFKTSGQLVYNEGAAPIVTGHRDKPISPIDAIINRDTSIPKDIGPKEIGIEIQKSETIKVEAQNNANKEQKVISTSESAYTLKEGKASPYKVLSNVNANNEILDTLKSGNIVIINQGVLATDQYYNNLPIKNKVANAKRNKKATIANFKKYSVTESATKTIKDIRTSDAKNISPNTKIQDITFSTLIHETPIDYLLDPNTKIADMSTKTFESINTSLISLARKNNNTFNLLVKALDDYTQLKTEDKAKGFPVLRNKLTLALSTDDTPQSKYLAVHVAELARAYQQLSKAKYDDYSYEVPTVREAITGIEDARMEDNASYESKEFTEVTKAFDGISPDDKDLLIIVPSQKIKNEIEANIGKGLNISVIEPDGKDISNNINEIMNDEVLTIKLGEGIDNPYTTEKMPLNVYNECNNILKDLYKENLSEEDKDSGKKDIGLPATVFNSGDTKEISRAFINKTIQYLTNTTDNKKTIVKKLNEAYNKLSTVLYSSENCTHPIVDNENNVMVLRETNDGWYSTNFVGDDYILTQIQLPAESRLLKCDNKKLNATQNELSAVNNLLQSVDSKLLLSAKSKNKDVYDILVKHPEISKEILTCLGYDAAIRQNPYGGIGIKLAYSDNDTALLAYNRVIKQLTDTYEAIDSKIAKFKNDSKKIKPKLTDEEIKAALTAPEKELKQFHNIKVGEKDVSYNAAIAEAMRDIGAKDIELSINGGEYKIQAQYDRDALNIANKPGKYSLRSNGHDASHYAGLELKDYNNLTANIKRKVNLSHAMSSMNTEDTIDTLETALLPEKKFDYLYEKNAKLYSEFEAKLLEINDKKSTMTPDKVVEEYSKLLDNYKDIENDYIKYKIAEQIRYLISQPGLSKEELENKSSKLAEIEYNNIKNDTIRQLELNKKVIDTASDANKMLELKTIVANTNDKNIDGEIYADANIIDRLEKAFLDYGINVKEIENVSGINTGVISLYNNMLAYNEGTYENNPLLKIENNIDDLSKKLGKIEDKDTYIKNIKNNIIAKEARKNITKENIQNYTKVLKWYSNTENRNLSPAAIIHSATIGINGDNKGLRVNRGSGDADAEMQMVYNDVMSTVKNYHNPQEPLFGPKKVHVETQILSKYMNKIAAAKTESERTEFAEAMQDEVLKIRAKEDAKTANKIINIAQTFTEHPLTEVEEPIDIELDGSLTLDTLDIDDRLTDFGLDIGALNEKQRDELNTLNKSFYKRIITNRGDLDEFINDIIDISTVRRNNLIDLKNENTDIKNSKDLMNTLSNGKISDSSDDALTIDTMINHYNNKIVKANRLKRLMSKQLDGSVITNSEIMYGVTDIDGKPLTTGEISIDQALDYLREPSKIPGKQGKIAKEVNENFIAYVELRRLQLLNNEERSNTSTPVLPKYYKSDKTISNTIADLESKYSNYEFPKVYNAISKQFKAKTDYEYSLGVISQAEYMRLTGGGKVPYIPIRTVHVNTTGSKGLSKGEILSTKYMMKRDKRYSKGMNLEPIEKSISSTLHSQNSFMFAHEMLNIIKDFNELDMIISNKYGETNATAIGINTKKDVTLQDGSKSRVDEEVFVKVPKRVAEDMLGVTPNIGELNNRMNTLNSTFEKYTPYTTDMKTGKKKYDFKGIGYKVAKTIINADRARMMAIGVGTPIHKGITNTINDYRDGVSTLSLNPFMFAKYYNKAIQLRFTDNESYSALVRQINGKVDKFDSKIDEPNAIKRTAKNIYKAIETENIAKVAEYYVALNEGLSEDEALEAAENMSTKLNVANGMLGKAVNTLGRTFGNSSIAGIVTEYNAVKRDVKGVAKGDLKSIGRILASLALMSLTLGAEYLSATLSGKEEEQAAIPAYYKTKYTFIFVGDKVFRIPNGHMSQLPRMLLRFAAGDMKDVDSVGNFLYTWGKGELTSITGSSLVDTIWQIADNETYYGSQIYNEYDSPEEKRSKALSYALKNVTGIYYRAYDNIINKDYGVIEGILRAENLYGLPNGNAYANRMYNDYNKTSLVSYSKLSEAEQLDKRYMKSVHDKYTAAKKIYNSGSEKDKEKAKAAMSDILQEYIVYADSNDKKKYAKNGNSYYVNGEEFTKTVKKDGTVSYSGKSTNDWLKDYGLSTK